MTIYPKERGLLASENYACHFCGAKRSEIGLLSLTLYSDTAETTIRACGPCLAAHHVRDILPSEESH